MTSNLDSDPCPSRAGDVALLIWSPQEESPKTHNLDDAALVDDDEGREDAVVLHVLSDLDLLLEGDAL